MSNKGNQATFHLHQEPMCDPTYTLIRKKGKLSIERIHFRYDRHQHAYVVQYRPSNNAVLMALSHVRYVARAIANLAEVGYIFAPK